MPLRSVLAPVLALLLSSGAVRAQGGGLEDAPPRPAPSTRIGGLEVPRVTPQNALAVLREKGRAPALEVEGSLAEWEAAPQVLEALQDWTRRGGVAILHTDAAQAFGFKTIAPRERSRNRASQLFGRARPALHFGLHPLLWKGLSMSGEGAAFGSLGVRLVFYRLEPGDALTLGHLDGVPILRETDITTPGIDAQGVATGTVPRDNGGFSIAVSEFREPWTSSSRRQEPGGPLLNVAYASALAPWGRGWALLTPRVIEAHRGDGRAFSANTARLIRGLASGAIVGVPSAPIERAYDRWKRKRRVDWARVADEVRRGIVDAEVEASPQAVQEMLARDSDQTLSPAVVAARFGPVRKAARSRAEADFFLAIANGAEAAKRRRLLYLAQSRFKILLSRADLERTLSGFERAGREQEANRLRAAKLPIEAGVPGANGSDEAEEAPLPGSAESVGRQAEEGSDSTDVSSATLPQSEDERTFASYRQAAGRMFILRTQTVAQGRVSFGPNSREWILTARRLDIEPALFWLWRGVMSAGEADNASSNAWLRGMHLGDAAASWQNALRATGDLPPIGRVGPDAEPLLPSPLEAFGTDADIARREALFEQARRQVLEARPGARRASWEQPQSEHSEDEDAGAVESPALPAEVGSVPGEEIARWVRGALLAREVARRDAPLGGDLIGTERPLLSNEDTYPRRNHPNLNFWWPQLMGVRAWGSLTSFGEPTVQYRKASISKNSSAFAGLSVALFADMGWKTVTARRWWLEDSPLGPEVQASALLGNGVFKPLSKQWREVIHEAGNPERYADGLRPRLISQCTQTLQWHSRRAEFGWGADREDIALCSGAASIQAITKAILAAQTAAAQDVSPDEAALAAASHSGDDDGAGSGANASTSGASTSGARASGVAGLRAQVARDRASRVGAMLPSSRAPLAVLASGAGGGVVLGTRIFIPTAPDVAQWKTAYVLDYLARNSGMLRLADTADWAGLKRALQRRQLRLAVGIPAALARAHADALIATVAEGGTSPPDWMREGFAALSCRYLARAMTQKGFPTNEDFVVDGPSRFLNLTPQQSDALVAQRNARKLAPGEAPGAAPVPAPGPVIERFDQFDDADGGLLWNSSEEFLASCAQIAVAGLDGSEGAVLLDRLYQEVGDGGVTEIMQRLGSGASADEAFFVVTGLGADDWAARQAGRRGRR